MLNLAKSFTDDTGRMVIIEPAKIPTTRDQLHTEQIATASEKATTVIYYGKDNNRIYEYTQAVIGT